MHDYDSPSLTTRRSTTVCDARTGKSIRDWILGRLIVEGDTAAGPDIYHWRLARVHHRRQRRLLHLAWSNPENIPWDSSSGWRRGARVFLPRPYGSPHYRRTDR